MSDAARQHSTGAPVTHDQSQDLGQGQDLSQTASHTGLNLFATGAPNAEHTPQQTSALSPRAHSPIGADEIGSISVWLGVVIGVILVASYLYKRLVGFRDQTGQAIHLVASRNVGQRERIAVVDVNGRRLTLGITGHSITQLDAQPAPGPANDDPAPTSERPPTFKQALATNLRRMTTRGSSQ